MLRATEIAGYAGALLTPGRGLLRSGDASRSVGVVFVHERPKEYERRVVGFLDEALLRGVRS